MSQKTDTSLLIKPIELGSPTIIQILNARATATSEVVSYLEQECEAILECRQCKSLFRSLANFISHKRAYCRGIHQDYIHRQGLYHTRPTEVVQPTDPDTDKFSAQPSRPTSSAKRTIAPRKKAKPIRRTTPSDLAAITDEQTSLNISPIEGVSCAVSQGTADGRSSAISNLSNQTESITTVEPKDGYPNMNLRQRTGRSNTRTDPIIDQWQDIEDEEEFENMTFTSKAKSLPSSKARLADTLSKRDDCDVNLMKCLPCDTTFSTAKALNFHMLNKHSKQRKLYPCIYCKNVFTQFWGVTRHLKRFHGLTGDTVDKIREKIRSRVFTNPGTGDTAELATVSAKHRNAGAQHQQSDSTSDKKKKNEISASLQGDMSNSSCTVCSKVFPKTQYLRLHMTACYKKAGLPPPDFQKQQPSTKSTKPILFVCKTCNRAFSARQNMAQHAVACSKRHKENNNSKVDSKEVAAKKTDSKEVAAKKTDSKEVAANKTDSKEISDKNADSEKVSDKIADSKEVSDKNADSKEVSDSKKTEPCSPGMSEQDENDQVQSQETKVATETKKTKNESATARGKGQTAVTAEKTTKKKDTNSKTSGSKLSPAKLDADDILMQLSPSDAVKEEEMSISPPSTPTPSTPTSLAQGRAKRNIKPKQFSDGTIRLIGLIEKVPEVVKVQQADGSEVYKLREDVEAASVAAPSKMTVIEEDQKPEEDIIKAKDTKAIRILIQGESVPLLDAEDEAKIGRMIDIRKLLCLKCKRQYGSSSNLRRHAVRHLGWRRYKCKLCKFTSYNKSECKSHLRKCHHSEVATLLDGGLAPYIIDLGALLEDSNDDSSTARLSLSLPATPDNGRASPVTRNSKAKSKESEPDTGVKESATAEPTEGNEEPRSRRSRKQRGRPRRQEVANEPAINAESTQSAASVSSEVSTTEAAPVRTRGRPRKQELNILANSDIVAQDENNKQPQVIKSSLENCDSSGASPAKVARLGDLVETRIDEVKLEAQSDKLEGVLNKIKSQSKELESTVKTVRKPLTGAGDNSTGSKSTTDIAGKDEAMVGVVTDITPNSGS